MDLLRAVALIAATISMGLMAGVFSLYANAIMPGLRRTDDRTFVGAFQAMDKAIVNPWFLGGGFLGALVFTGLAGVLHLGGAGRAGLPWIVAAFALYLAAFAITVAVNVPLNNEIKGPAMSTASPTWPSYASGSTKRSGRGGTSSARSPPPSRWAASPGPSWSTDAWPESRRHKAAARVRRRRVPLGAGGFRAGRAGSRTRAAPGWGGGAARRPG